VIERDRLEQMFREHGLTDYKWIDPRRIVVAEWVRMKCTFGCSGYGSAACPPNTPPVEECRRFINDYHEGVVFHFVKAVDRPEDRHAWALDRHKRLLELERVVFLSGCYKAFMLPSDSCSLCPESECASKRAECHHLEQARPAPEAMAIDVFATVRQYGFPIEVLSDTTQAMNRYAFLLIE
jgi:predicted metal-binding protein